MHFFQKQPEELPIEQFPVEPQIESQPEPQIEEKESILDKPKSIEIALVKISKVENKLGTIIKKTLKIDETNLF